MTLKNQVHPTAGTIVGMVPSVNNPRKGKNDDHIMTKMYNNNKKNDLKKLSLDIRVAIVLSNAVKQCHL